MNLPEKFKQRMKDMLAEEYEDFLKSYEKDAFHSLRMNPLKGDTEEGAARLNLTSGRVAWEKEGYYYEEGNRAGKHPYHDAGLYYLQEASAMLPAALLRPRPGERILDLCAAPGGKSTQIGAYMEGRGILVCNEIHPTRAKVLSENIERMGICNAVVTNETPQKLETYFPEYFDGILVDAPCSGEGMFRKNEEACGEWSPENVELCARRQDEILDCASGMLRPGGRMVYSTCTFAPEENEGSISRFLRRHPDFKLLEPPFQTEEMCEGVPEWGEDALSELRKTIRLWPHRIKGEGHFAAILCRTGENASDEASICETDGTMQKEKAKKSKTFSEKREPERGISEKELREYVEFRDAFLTKKEEGIYLKFGSQLYLAPEGTPLLDGLKVLRPGLHLGTIKKNRFEPSHALALALRPSDVRYQYDFPADGAGIKAYLNGQTFLASGDKGWYLVTVDSYGVGWGKLAGDKMKNHYPRGLRK